MCNNNYTGVMYILEKSNKRRQKESKYLFCKVGAKRLDIVYSMRY